MCELELARLAGHRTGEGALLVTEQLALHQVLGQRGAVHRDERLAGTTTLVVDGPSDQLLPCAGFSDDQHRAVGRRHKGYLGKHLAQAVALAHDTAATGLTDLAPQMAHVVPELPPLLHESSEAVAVQFGGLIQPRVTHTDSRLRRERAQPGEFRRAGRGRRGEPRRIDPEHAHRFPFIQEGQT